jgi:hypothetical protein
MFVQVPGVPGADARLYSRSRSRQYAQPAVNFAGVEKFSLSAIQGAEQLGFGPEKSR